MTDKDSDCRCRTCGLFPNEDGGISHGYDFCEEIKAASITKEERAEIANRMISLATAEWRKWADHK